MPETKEKMKHCFNQYVCKVASGVVFFEYNLINEYCLKENHQVWQW